MHLQADGDRNPFESELPHASPAPLPSPFAAALLRWSSPDPLSPLSSLVPTSAIPLTYFVSTETLLPSPTPHPLSRIHTCVSGASADSLISDRVSMPSSWSAPCPGIRLSYVCARARHLMQRLLVSLFNLLSRNSDSAVAFFQIPPEQVMVMGQQLQIETTL